MFQISKQILNKIKKTYDNHLTEYLSSEHIQYEKPEIEEYLVIYNELLANILVEGSNKLKYIASATINRLEAQTHFYEYVEKYIQIIEKMDSNPALNIRICKRDHLLYVALKKRYGLRITRDYRNKKTTKCIFLLKILLTYITIFTLASFEKLRFKPKNAYKYIVRTYFDFRSIENSTGFLRDEYFDPLLKDLKRTGDVLVVYKLINHLNWYNFRTFIKAKKDVGFDSCLLEYFLSPMEISKAFISFMKSRIQIGTPLIYKGQDISQLMNTSLLEDYYRCRGLVVYIEYYLAQQLLKLEADRIFYPFENQTWEKMYPLIKEKGNYATVIVGFQHTGFSYKLLNHFPTMIEKHLPFFPDRILTTGHIFKNLLQNNAHLPSLIKVGAALRHDSFVRNGKFVFKYPVNKLFGKIAYAFSSDIEKHIRIINLLLEIFGSSTITVFLKFHPLFEQNMILKKLNFVLPRNFIPAVKMSWKDIYNSVDAIVYDDNSISIEGILNGVKTYMLDEEEPIYNIERMFGFNEWNSSLNKDGLIKLRESIINETFDKTYSVENVREYISGYFSEYSTEKVLSRFTN